MKPGASAKASGVLAGSLTMSMPFNWFGRRWEVLRGCDGGTDTAYLELWDVTRGWGGELVLFAERPDATGVITVTHHRRGLPEYLVEWFTREALDWLPPMHPNLPV
jgi:hypothetical protein